MYINDHSSPQRQNCHAASGLQTPDIYLKLQNKKLNGDLKKYQNTSEKQEQNKIPEETYEKEPDSQPWIYGFGYTASDSRIWTHGFSHLVSDSRNRLMTLHRWWFHYWPWVGIPKHHHNNDETAEVCSDSWLWTHGFGLMGSDSCLRTHDFGLMTSDSWAQTHGFRLMGSDSWVQTHAFGLMGSANQTRAHGTDWWRYTADEFITPWVGIPEHHHNMDEIAEVRSDSWLRSHRFGLTGSDTWLQTHGFGLMGSAIRTRAHGTDWWQYNDDELSWIIYRCV